MKNTLITKNNISVLIAAGIGYIILKMFLDERIIDIPKGTAEGVIITSVGYVAIIATIIVVTLVIQMLLNKKKRIK